ncbi:MAG: putative DNA binding domain-containing protein [bacterium]|nr:putative DNA binding domain-containing protein [bacterium]
MPSNTDLERMIRLGDSSSLELKRVLVQGSKVVGPRWAAMADTVAGMANSKGGTIVLGVDDRTREVLGIPLARLDIVERWMAEICLDALNPPLNATIRRLELPDVSWDLVPVLRVDVPRSLFVYQSPGGYEQRTGRSTRSLQPQVLARLLQERSQTRLIRFDESVVPGSGPGDLVPELATPFLRGRGDLSEQNLRRIGVIARDDQGTTCLTVAGALMCTGSPGDWLPHAYIQAVSYAGERRDINYQRDAGDLSGPLDTQVSEALHFARRNMSARATKGVGRTERPQYSDRAVFEALVNAVAHRDYSMAGARIRLHIFRDRIELYVPGSLANTLTIDSMADRQYCRNELIVSLLARCPVDEDGLARRYLMERRGDGVPIILDESRDLSGRYPDYTMIDDSELRLVIWAAETRPGEERA